MKKKLLYVFMAAVIFFSLTAIVGFASAKIYADNRSVSAFSDSAGKPVVREGIDDTPGAFYKHKSISFEDGSEFNIFRFQFGLDEGKPYSYKVSLRGNSLNMHWQNYEEKPSRLDEAVFSDGMALPKATLFLETEEESMIVSIPALYYSKFDHKTLECLPEREQPLKISKSSGGYTIVAEFAPLPQTIGELWYYKCRGKLFNEWNSYVNAVMLPHDFHKDRRFSFDGYYFRTYTTYSPYSENGFFRNAANFSGARLLKTKPEQNCVNLGYAMTKICAANQNAYGFWETGPESSWLKQDYGIGYDFYDTRFSTDFARSLIIAYEEYGEKEMMDRAVTYAEFLISFAETEGYRVGKDAILVPDYWGAGQTKKTHVSLNHQLDEINFLLELYRSTKMAKYNEYAYKLLKGVELTAEDWIMEDSNLKYALMYEESVNLMVDYPYLTYNDLLETKKLLMEQGRESSAIERLMSAKKIYMDKNGITGYNKQ